MKNQVKETTRFFFPKRMCIYFLKGKEELFVVRIANPLGLIHGEDTACHGVALEGLYWAGMSKVE